MDRSSAIKLVTQHAQSIVNDPYPKSDPRQEFDSKLAQVLFSQGEGSQAHRIRSWELACRYYGHFVCNSTNEWCDILAKTFAFVGYIGEAA